MPANAGMALFFAEILHIVSCSKKNASGFFAGAVNRIGDDKNVHKNFRRSGKTIQKRSRTDSKQQGFSKITVLQAI